MTKKMTNEDKVLVGTAVVGAGILGFLWWKKRKASQESLLVEQAEEKPKALPQGTSNKGASKPKAAAFDSTKMLSMGSKGLEVRELQKLLGFTGVDVDGDFGNDTLTALQAKKGVSSISIATYASVVKKSATAKPTAFVTPKVGQKIMSIAKDTAIFNAEKTAAGTYYNTGVKPFIGAVFGYGEHIGTFITVNKSGKYLVNRQGVYYFVDRTKVKAY